MTIDKHIFGLDYATMGPDELQNHSPACAALVARAALKEADVAPSTVSLFTADELVMLGAFIIHFMPLANARRLCADVDLAIAHAAESVH